MKKFDLNVYDNLARDMRIPKVIVGDTKKLTELPDEFEPSKNFTEFNNWGEEEIGKVIP
jgi:hypothetical protein